MKRPLLLAVSEGAGAFAELVVAVGAAGGRAGWLELAAVGPAPPELETAAAAGVLRAVAAVGGRVLTVKPVRGRPVLDDLVREHFRGCALVLVRGGEGLARLEPRDDGWGLVTAGGRQLVFSTAELVARLGRPSFHRRLAGAD